MKRCIAAAGCACGIATASAATVTLTFDHFDDPLYPPSYTQSGFIITSLFPDGGHLHSGDGSLWLHSREGSSPYQIRRVDGGSFDFLKFDYSGGDSVFTSNTGVSFTILGDQPLATFTMPASFKHVSYIDWYMNNPGDLSTPNEQWGQIDNVVLNVSPAPEPAQAAMLGLGLAGLLLHARRSQRRRVKNETGA
jgi:MYXO-CTERM domain-containing protein